MAIETAHLPHHLCRGLLQFDLENRSLYEILRQEYGLSLCLARQTFQVSLSTPREMELLGLTSQSPMLLTERVTYLKEGLPVECVRSVYRGDRYKVHTILRCDA